MCLALTSCFDGQEYVVVHIAARPGWYGTIYACVKAGADILGENFSGESLERAVTWVCLGKYCFDTQVIRNLLTVKNPSIWMLDTGHTSVLYRIVKMVGVEVRGVAAQYCLYQGNLWIANHEWADLCPIIDMQDEHGITVLNITTSVEN